MMEENYPDSTQFYSDIYQSDQQTCIASAISKVSHYISFLNQINASDFSKEAEEFHKFELVGYWRAMTKVSLSSKNIDKELSAFYYEVVRLISKLDFPSNLLSMLCESMEGIRTNLIMFEPVSFSPIEKVNLMKFDGSAKFIKEKHIDLSVTQTNQINSLVECGFLFAIKEKIFNESISSDQLCELLKIFQLIEPYISANYATVIIQMFADAAIDIFPKDKQNASTICQFFSDFIKIIPDKSEKILKILCSIVLDNSVQIQYHILTAICRIVQLAGICNSGPNVKAAFLIAASSQNEDLSKLALNHLPTIGGKTPILLEDIESLYQIAINLDSTQPLDAIIALLPLVHDSLDNVTSMYLQGSKIYPPFNCALIERTRKDNIKMDLFKHLISQPEILERTDFQTVRMGDKFARLMKDVAAETQNIDILTSLSYLFIGNPKHEAIISYLQKIIHFARSFPAIINSITKFSAILDQFNSENVYCHLLHEAFDSIQNGNPDTTSALFSVLSVWTVAMKSIPGLAIVQKIMSSALNPFPDELPYYINRVIEKLRGTKFFNKTTDFLFKMLIDSVPERHANWLTRTLLNSIYSDKQQIANFVSICMNQLAGEKRAQTAEIIISAACLEADFFRINDFFGYQQKVSFHLPDSEPVVTNISLHPFHSARRLYYLASIALNRDTNTFSLFAKDEINEEEFKFISPLTSLSLDLSKRIDFKAYPLKTSFDIDSLVGVSFESLKSHPFLSELSNPVYLNLLYQMLIPDDFVSQKLFQVLMLFETFANMTQPMSILQTICSGSIQSIIPFLDMPYVLQYAIRAKCQSPFGLTSDEIQLIVVNLSTVYLDRVSTAIACDALQCLNVQCIFSHDQIKTAILDCENDMIKNVILHMVSPETPSQIMISLLPLTALPEYRSKADHFYKLISGMDVPPELYIQIFSDLQQFEFSHYGDIDQTFICLLKLIPRTTEMLSLTIKRLFSPPVCQNLNTPFIHTIESWSAALTFIKTKESVPLILSFFNNLPTTPSLHAELNDDFSYKGRSGIMNLGATCYVSSVLQAMNTIPDTISTLLQLDSSMLSPFLNNLRIIFSQLIFGRGTSISVDGILDNATIFNKTEQHDVEEFFTFMINKMKEDMGNSDVLVEQLAGTSIVQISNEKEVISTKEENFFLLPLITNELTNLYQSLKQYFTPQLVNSDGNKTMHSSIIKKWPNYLTLQLARWKYDFQKGIRNKLTHEFDFPLVLQHESLMSATGSDPGCNYRLTAIVVHSGTAEQGHYFTIVQGADKDWFICDDEHVKYFNPEQIPCFSYGGAISSDARGNVLTAYLLFYKRCDINDISVSIPSDLEETLDMANSNSWTSIIYFSKQFVDYTLDLLAKNPTDSNVIQLAELTLFKVAVSQEINLYSWCSKFSDIIFTSHQNCLLFFRIISRHIGESLPLIIAISDNVAAELSNLINIGIARVTDSTEPLVIMLKSMGVSSTKRCYLLVYQVIYTAMSVLNIDWSTEDDALTLMVQHLVNENLKEAANPIGKLPFLCIQGLSTILIDVCERRGVTDAMLALFEPSVLQRIAFIGSRIESFIMLLTSCISQLPSINESIKEHAGKNADIKALLQSVTANGATLCLDIPDIDMNFFWKFVPRILFDRSATPRRQFSAHLMKLIRQPDQKMNEFYSISIINQDVPKPPFLDGSSVVLFFVSFIPIILQNVRKGKTSITAEAIEVVLLASTVSPFSASFYIDDIIELIRIIPDENLMFKLIRILHHTIAYDINNAKKVPIDVIEIILQMRQNVTMEIMHFLLVFKEHANYSKLSGICVGKALHEHFDQFGIVLTEIIRDGMKPGPFEIPFNSPGLDNIRLGLVLWDACEDRREELIDYLLSALTFAKPLRFFRQTKIVNSVFELLADICPCDLEKIMKSK